MKSSVHVFYPKIIKNRLFVLYCAHLFVPLSRDHWHIPQRRAGVTFVGKYNKRLLLFGIASRT